MGVPTYGAIILDESLDNVSFNFTLKSKMFLILDLLFFIINISHISVIYQQLRLIDQACHQCFDDENNLITVNVVK